MSGKIFNRITAIIIQDGKLLLLKQDTDNGRSWSLPGGKQEPHESVGEALVREVKEETGLDVTPDRLLYVADHVASPEKRILHITFKANVVGGTVGNIEEGKDTVPIESVEFVPIEQLGEYGFSDTFINILKSDFPGTGEKVYVGPKSEIGL